VVFDHIEEGAEEILSVLRSVLEFGALAVTSEEGSSKVSFTNSIVFITCNNFVPQDENAPGVRKFLGFEAGSDKAKAKHSNNDRRRYLRGIEELKEHFPGKFLSRIDRVEILKEYSQEARLEIVELFIAELMEILSLQFPIMLVIDKEVKEFIVREGSDHPELGIRLLKKKFNKYIRTNLGLLITKGLAKPNDAFRVSLVKKENEEHVQFSKMDVPNLPSTQ
jgi:ATP-dependent Clp protease ATP-binding subunit ClpA